ncbi:MAG: transcriptional repressor [Bacteroidales bacterium]|nr:transcriptional repressor [Bacteroidales bacterium]
MEFSIEDIRQKISQQGLKVTPQRIAILDAIYKMKNHPTAENIIEYIRKGNPNIASGTVYKVLDTLIGNGLVKKVNTERDVMRYDGMVNHHHHLHYIDSDRIEDYEDEELDNLLKDYFNKKKIRDFTISEITLQIKGTYGKA